jgi:two-component system, response regulator RegA
VNADSIPDTEGSEAACKHSPQVLLVEDDSALRAILAEALRLHDYQISATDNRHEAQKILREQPAINVMVIDLGLPPYPNDTREGIELIREITRANNSAKIIVLTGQDEESSALAAIREGAFDFLAKPASLQEIDRAIKRALLFVRQEEQMADEGFTRLQINARVAEGLKAVREDAEEKLVRQVLKDTGFNVYQSAARLGLKRESIYYFLKKFGINRDA